MTPDLFSLTDRVALVTGASSGLGRHFSKVLASAGANIIAAARRTDRLQELVVEIEAEGGRAVAATLDVTEPASVESLFESAAAGPIDVVVNCAGIAAIGKFVDMDEATWNRVLEVNLNGVRRVCQHAARRMIETQRPGSIVNIASVAGIGAAPQWTAYATSKAAVIHLTKTMATELWKHKIRVNALCPGYFPSEINEEFFASEKGRAYLAQIPPRRTGELHELSGPLLLLASDASSYMTGAALPVDGGHSIRLI